MIVSSGRAEVEAEVDAEVDAEVEAEAEKESTFSTSARLSASSPAMLTPSPYSLSTSSCASVAETFPSASVSAASNAANIDIARSSIEEDGGGGPQLLSGTHANAARSGLRSSSASAAT